MPKLSCIAPLLQHPDVVNHSLNVVHVAVPKVTGRNEKSVCGVQSIHKHTTRRLKSDSALKKSNFVKQHIMRVVEGKGRGCWESGDRGAAWQTPSSTCERHLLPNDHADVAFILMQHAPWAHSS